MEGFGWLAIGGGFLLTCWSYIRSFLWRIISHFVIRAKLEISAGDALLLYCWRNLKRSPFGERRYQTFRNFVRPLQRYQVIGFEKLGGDFIVFWKGWRPLLLSLSEGDPQRPHAMIGVHVTTLRWLFDLDKLLIDSLTLYNREQSDLDHERFTVERQFGSGSIRARTKGDMVDSPIVGRAENETINPEWRILQYQRNEIGADKPVSPWKSLTFPLEIQEMIEEVRRWKASENWYREKGIPWRRGYLLWGLPGVGKTSLARAIAQDLDLPVIAFDLSSYSNQDFINSWRRLMSRVPCMALLEDIDAVFKGRENRLGEEGGGLSFDCLLNCLSGIESADGVLVIVTTNRIEDLDDALGVPNEQGISTRPGRIDRAVELLALDDNGRRRIAERILCDCSDEIEQAIVDGQGESGAQFTDRCSKIALDRFWNRTNRNGEIKRIEYAVKS